jgi:hypothetical protein
MAKQVFKIPGGCADAKFAYLEQLIPKMQRRLGVKTVGITPPSIMTHYIHSLAENGVVLKCVLFDGTVDKVCFNITFIEDKIKPTFICTLTQDGKIQSVEVTSKKCKYVADINTPVSDGDILEIICTSGWDKVQDIHISTLITLSKKHTKLVKAMTDELLAEVEADEGI